MLQKHSAFPGIQGPVVMLVLDGYGISPKEEGNAIKKAYTPNLDRLFAQYPNTLLKAHGKAVGMPSDKDMGNSEVGHNAIGSGQVFSQGAALVSQAIEAGTLFEGQAWQDIIKNTHSNNSMLHLIGLFSDGNVHSHINHLKALILKAKAQGVKTLRVHILLDGRDVPETSALEYTEPFEQFLTETSSGGFDARVASGGGRMNITMDRYEANWKIVEKGWHTHVLGQGPVFPSATQAIKTLREQNAGTIDQDLPPFIIGDNEKPCGTINDGDSVIFFNFRGDRAIEITKAFESESFDYFDRQRVPKVTYAGMLEYDGDLKIPSRYLVNPPEIKNTMGEYLARDGITQLAISETQKFGHVTYFWNGNRSGKFSDDLETYIEVPSDVIPFEQRPWMKSAEIADKLISELKTNKHTFARANFANADMVGHTGIYLASIIAVEAVDLALSRILPVISKLGGLAIITADHGNADEMFELDKKTKQPIPVKGGGFKAKTSHTLNPVPCIFYYTGDSVPFTIKQGADFGLSNLAATCVNLMGYQAPDIWDESIISFK